MLPSTSSRLFFLLATLLCLGVSCGSKEESLQDFAGRFAAADAISTDVERDQALVAVATDAARVGNSEVATKAISEMSSQITADSTASQAALALAEAGYPAAATELAQLISSTIERDATLSKIAKAGD